MSHHRVAPARYRAVFHGTQSDAVDQCHVRSVLGRGRRDSSEEPGGGTAPASDQGRTEDQVQDQRHQAEAVQ